MPLSERRTAHLRWGRESLPGATYFVTACVRDRERVFADPKTTATAVATLAAIHAGGDARLHAAVVMPDHVHLLFTLGARLELGQVIGKFKTLCRNRGRAHWRWQEDGFEHRLRPSASIEDFAFYMFMNPYRAGLVPLSHAWSGWFCPERDQFRFLASLTARQPVPMEWIEKSNSTGARIGIRR